MQNRLAYLGIKFDVSSEEIFVSQSKYTEKILQRFKLDDSNPGLTPVESHPDISFAVNYLSRFNSKPTESHWKMFQRIFQYLKGKVKFGIFFNGESTMSAYSNSDCGRGTFTGCSTSGVLIMREDQIVWFAQKQRLPRQPANSE